MENKTNNKPTMTYHLFLYREELARRNARQLRLSKTKIEITDKLVTSSVKNLRSCSSADLLAVSREIIYKRKLSQHVAQLRHAGKKEKKSGPWTVMERIMKLKRESLES